jgi:DNA repair protein RadC
MKRDQGRKSAGISLHDHPSGEAATEALGIAIHDHLVIGREGHASFGKPGLLA